MPAKRKPTTFAAGPLASYYGGSNVSRQYRAVGPHCQTLFIVVMVFVEQFLPTEHAVSILGTL